MFGRAGRDIVRFYRRSWWFVALVQLASGLLVAVPLALVAQVANLVVVGRGGALADPAQLGPIALALLVTSVVVCFPLALAGVAATVRVTNDSLAGRERRFRSAFTEGLRRMPALTAAGAITLVGTVILVVLSPVLTVVGLVALLLTPAVRLARRRLQARRPDALGWWPDLVLLAWVTAPIGLALRFVSGAMFFAPAIMLEGLGPIEALRAGELAARPRRLRLVGFVVAGSLASIAAQIGLAYLGSLAGSAGSLAGQVLVQLFFVALPVVIVTVLYRLSRASTPDGGLPASPTVPYATAASALAPRRRIVGATVPDAVRRVAMAMPFVVVIAGIGLAPTPAMAAPVSAGSLTLTVTTAADSTDEQTVADQAANCLSGAGQCTLRAAARAAQDAASSGDYGSIVIGFAASFTITLPAASPITLANFGSGGEGEGSGGGEGGEGGEGGGEGEGGVSGLLTLTGDGHTVVLDGGGASQLISFHSNSWGLQLTDLQVSNGELSGSEALGAGVSITTPAASFIDSVTFNGNRADVGGGAVLRSGGTLTVTNSTFAGNSSGSNSAVGYPNGGADLYALYGAVLTVNNSTFVGYSGSSVLSWSASGASAALNNSLFDPRDGTSAAACTGGGLSGSANVVSGTDTSCPDAIANPGPSVSELRTLPAGGPAVMTLVPSEDNAAIGASGTAVECAPVDQRGLSRAALGCDAGAVVLDPTTSTALASSLATPVVGSDVTFTATVALADGGTTITTGAVSFSIDGAIVGPSLPVTSGSASLTTDELSAGGHTVVATYIPVDPARIAGSTSAALAQEVAKSGSTVTLGSSANPALASVGVTVTATVTAQEPDVIPTGTVTLRDAGEAVASVTLVGGVASFDVSALAPGRHTLIAEYAGDNDNTAANSAALDQVIRVASSLQSGASPTILEFGRDVTVTVTVPTVSSVAPASGSVTVAWRGGSRALTLDSTGSATTVIRGIAVDASTITATYAGDDRYAPSTATEIPVIVSPAATTTALAVADSSISFGVPVELTATVSRTNGSAPAGTVTFYAGATALQTITLAAGTGSSSVASYTPAAASLPVGSNSLTARFTPSAGFIASTSAVAEVTVGKSAATVEVTSDAPSAPFGTPVLLTATVGAAGDSVGVPDGSVEFFDGPTSLGTAVLSAGVATLTQTLGSRGSHSITARYLGSASFTARTSEPYLQSVAAEGVVTRLTVSPGSTRYGAALTFDVDVTGASNGIPGVGSVVVREGSTVVATIPLGAGAGSRTIPSPSAGTHSYRATFVPSSADFEGGMSDVVSHTVGAADSTTTLAFSAPSSVHGDAVTLTATVSSADAAPVGTVTFSTGDLVLGTAAVAPGAGGSSVATLTVGLPQSADYPQGERDVVATFAPSADFSGSAAAEPFAVARGTTSLRFELVGGKAGEPQALVATVTTITGTGSPVATVRFTGSQGATGTVTLVDGVGTLEGVTLPAGNHLVQATYSSLDRNFTAPVPDAAVEYVTVAAGTPTVTLGTGSTGPISYGSSVRLTATVASTGIAPTGTVRFVATGSAGTRELGSVALAGSGSPCCASTAVLDSLTIPIGTQSIAAEYLGDGNFVAVTSTSVTQVVTATPTSIALTSSPSPSVPLEEITLRAAVTAGTGTVDTGAVQFLLGGVVLDTVTVSSAGIATYRYTPGAVSDLALTARYSSASGDFAPSSAVVTHRVDGRGVTMTLFNAGAYVPVGEARTVRVQLRAGAIATLPSGVVTIGDGEGTSCDAVLTATNEYGVVAGACDLRWSGAGMRTITATYAGDTLYASSTAGPIYLLVSTRETGLSLTTPARWIGGQPATLNWAVVGPPTPGAIVTLTEGSTEICRSTALAGSCTYTFAEGRGEGSVVMRYAGTAEWAYQSTILTEPITTCVRVGTSSVSPSNGGTVVVETRPNCGISGYLPGTFVTFRAIAADGFTFGHWFDAADVNQYTYVKAEGIAVIAQATFLRPCVEVTITALGGSRYGAGEIESPTNPNCGAGWVRSDYRSRTAMFSVGTVIDLKAVVPSVPRGTSPWALYEWTGLAAGADPTALRQSYTVGTDPFQQVSASFGVTCVRDVRISQPAGGTVTLGGPNCYDNLGAGYLLGSRIPITARATGDGYFTQWSGNIDPLTKSSTVATGTLQVYETNPVASASFGACVSFSVNSRGYVYRDVGDVPTGSVTVDLAGNCPTKGAGWYTPGTYLRVNTTGLLGTTFGGWTTNAELRTPSYYTNNTIFVTQSGSAEAFWYSQSQCKPFSVTAAPSGSLTLATDLHGENSCPEGMFNTNAGGYQGLKATFTATPTSGDPIVGWTGTTKRFKDRETEVTALLAPTTGREITVSMVGTGSYTAWACQAINTNLTLVSPNGTEHTGPLPSGTDFVAASPAPNCPLTANAYTVGQDVFPQALGESSGYTFVGWSGAVTSTDLYPTTGIALDGQSKRVDLTAKYKVNCFTLTTNTQHTKAEPAPNCPDTDASENKYIGGTQVTLQTIGNAGNKVFRGFTGDFDGQSGIYSWVTLDRDSAIYSNYETRSVGEAIKDALSDAADATAIAAKKAVGVVAAAAAAFVMGDNPVLLVASLVVLLGAGVQGIADAFGLSSQGLTNFTGGITALSQMLTFMQAGATCATVWSASGSVSQPPSTGTTAAGTAGAILAKRVKEARDAAAAARESERAAQAAAITAMNDARLWNAAIANGDEAVTATGRAANYVSSAVSSASQKASDAMAAIKGPLKTVGRLGDVAMVGYMVYSEYQNANTGWDSSAKSAWTTGGDVYMNCLMDAVPPYFGVPPRQK